MYTGLQACAAEAGLDGNIVLVWKDADTRTRIVAQPQEEPFFRLVKYDQLRAQLSATPSRIILFGRTAGDQWQLVRGFGR